MKTFTDKSDNARAWEIRIDINAFRALRLPPDQGGLELTLTDEAELIRLNEDLVLFCDLLYWLIQDQAQEAGIGDADFGRLLYDCFDEASDAFWDEFADFCRKHRREPLAMLIQKTKTNYREASKRATRKIGSPKATTAIEAVMKASEAEADRKLDQMIQEAEATIQKQTSKPLLTDSPASSG